jgi:hypothetical protein
MLMGWPTLKEFAISDKVKVRRAAVTQDASKGRKYTYPADWEAKQYGCAVLVASAEEVDQFSREGQVVRYTVIATQRLGVYRDQFQWQETGAVLTIVSVMPSGDSTARTWDHHCEEHTA